MPLRLLPWLMIAAVALSASQTTAGNEPRYPGTFRVVWADGRAAEIPTAEMRRYTISAPDPEYPPEAGSRLLGGVGLYELRINKAGAVTGIVITKSTGHPELDRATMRALIRYRYKPGAFRKVYEPIIYTVHYTR